MTKDAFKSSPHYATAKRVFEHRMAAPEAWEESHEYAIAVRSWNRCHHPIERLRRRPFVQSFGFFALGVLSGMSVLTCVYAENSNTLLKQGEPHPGLSRVAPSGALVNPDRNG